jgi:hypothetical protein
MRLSTTLALIAALAAAPAEAASFRFTFQNVDGDVAGTVTGTVSGLPEDGTAPATGVVITSAPIAFTTYPLDILAQGWTELLNSFTVANGAITAYTLLIGLAPGFDEPHLNPGYSGAGFNMGDNAEGVLDLSGNSVAFTRLTEVEAPVPAPAGIGLLAAGLLGLLLVRRRA